MLFTPLYNTLGCFQNLLKIATQIIPTFSSLSSIPLIRREENMFFFPFWKNKRASDEI